MSVGELTLYPIDCRAALASSLILYPPPHRPRLAANLPRREDEFQGAPILRSKFAPIAQDQIRKLRRELLKNGPNSAPPAPNAR